MKILLLGYGTVARGVAELIEKNRELITARTGKNPKIVAVFTRSHKPDCPYLQLHDLDSALAQECDIVCELMGGTTDAKTAIWRALALGRDVITANKALLAECRYELEAALAPGQFLGYEASVAGGVPIIKIIKNGLVANEINKIIAILNGTSNYICSKMSSEGCDFAAALAAAQKLGYAEADPTLDISGQDAAHKLIILASLAFGVRAKMSDILCEGIDKLNALDFSFAKDLDYEIKPIASAILENGELRLRVHPAMICKDNILASVNSNKNAILLDDNALGTSLYYGAGAGSLETASAVLSDILEPCSERAMLGFKTPRDFGVAAIENMRSKYYLRCTVDDQVGVLADITAALAAAKISVDAIEQKPSANELRTVFITTHEASEKQLKTLQDSLLRQPFMREEIAVIRIM